MAHRYLYGLFDDEGPLFKVIPALKEGGHEIHDVITPFPVHGLDPVLGLKETKLHTTGFLFGAFGCTFALLTMGYISAYDWPNIFGGKPNFSLPAFIPITFEMSILCASVGMVIVYYLRNNLSLFKDPEILEPATSDDRFAVVFDMDKLGGEEAIGAITNILKDCGAVEIKQREMGEKQLSFDEQS